jgi:hypothetical protein
VRVRVRHGVGEGRGRKGPGAWGFRPWSEVRLGGGWRLLRRATDLQPEVAPEGAKGLISAWGGSRNGGQLGCRRKILGRGFLVPERRLGHPNTQRPLLPGFQHSGSCLLFVL